MADDKRVYLFDSTLRDGAQTQGVDFSADDKAAIAQALDRLGVDYVEGGWPGANPTDDAFFAQPPTLRGARLVAFGMTRRPGRSAANDPGLNALLNAKVDSVCMVGKAWDFHVDVALGVSQTENVDMIAESIAHAQTRMSEVMFDAEHFFDGYKADPAFALQCAEAAYKAGARWVVLCDTNGGTLPHEIERIVGEATAKIPGSHLGIHCHNDTENAVANSLAAVRAGARQIQGTLNGLGERCGNANLISLIPSLMLKTDFTIGLSERELAQLTHISRLLDERLNRAPSRHAAYVGDSAFAH
ncbi:MAG TPA: citramalate synthase, partial [Dongiaceae bacterium]